MNINHNPVTLNRLKAQIAAKNLNIVNKMPVFHTNIVNEEILTIDELQYELNNVYPEKVISKDVIISDIQEFPDLFHFVDWYLQNSSQFTQKQNDALKTLVQVKDSINIGCACKRTQRLNSAANYFKVFWENNSKTDLISMVLKICKKNRVSFGNFLIFPLH